MYIDCENVVSAALLAALEAPSGRKVYSGLVREAKEHGVVERFGAHKVKAHVSETEAATAIDKWLAKGNGHADDLAKRGVELHPQADPAIAEKCRQIAHAALVT